MLRFFTTCSSLDAITPRRQKACEGIECLVDRSAPRTEAQLLVFQSTEYQSAPLRHLTQTCRPAEGPSRGSEAAAAKRSASPRRFPAPSPPGTLRPPRPGSSDLHQLPLPPPLGLIIFLQDLEGDFLSLLAALLPSLPPLHPTPGGGALFMFPGMPRGGES
ncbi:hypothetical protein MC885_004584 [Smutsia gigantea]|nr:hypothetical protein MC885_004584 [Smutsia gigantea]